MSEAPLPELKESEATGPIADIYDDIRNSLNVPMVNLLFRHMATVPGCLEWAWANLGPLYISGRWTEAATKICADQTRPTLLLTRGDARTCGLHETDIESVRTTSAAYARANPANLLALKALHFIIDETAGGYARRKPMRGQLARAAPTAIPPLPPMGDLQTVPSETLKVLQTLARQVHGEDGPVIPSFYRHFTAWPAFLGLLHQRMESLIPSINESAAILERAAHVESRGLYLDCPAIARDPPSANTIATLKALIARFPPNICKMTLVAMALDSALEKDA